VPPKVFFRRAWFSDLQTTQIVFWSSSTFFWFNFHGLYLSTVPGEGLRRQSLSKREYLVYYSPALPSPFIDSARTCRLKSQERYMLTRTTLLICVVCAIVLVGCSKSAAPTNEGAAAPANTNKPAAAPAKSETASAQKIGVPECDNFIAAYDACVSDKVPEAARAQYKTAIAQWRASWTKLAENPQTKPTLVAACKQSAESARASMKSYNCTF
jgi:hypothetical protein